MAYTFTRTAAQIEEIHNTVEDPKSNSQFSDDIRTIAGEYRGLWPDTGGSANKGDTYQTQVSGTPTGQYFTALQSTTVDPVGDDVNWRMVVSNQSLGGMTNYQAASVADMIAGKPVGWQSGDAVIAHKAGEVWDTTGYHSKNDGGNCKYLVINESDFPYANKFQFDGVFHHSANDTSLMFYPLLENNTLNSYQAGVITDDNTKRSDNVTAWNNGSFACAAFRWKFLSIGSIHTNNTLFIQSFSDVQFGGRCEIINDDTGTNEFGTKAILANYPISLSHKSFIELTGTVILKYIRDDANLSTGNGYEIGNMSTSNLDGFECRVFDAEKAVFGHSIVDTIGGSFQANDCHTACELIPNAGVTSDASASTSFEFDVRASRCVKGVVCGTAYYSEFRGWTDGSKLANPRRKSGEMPISILVKNNSQQVSFRNFGTEQCDGMFLRVENGSNANVEVSSVPLASDVFQSDQTLVSDVPFDEQGWFSVGEACSVDITNPIALLPYTPATDTWIFSIGQNSKVNVQSGKIGFNGSGPKLFFARGDLTHLWINGTRNVPNGWNPGYEYHGNNKATFSGSAITDASGEAVVPFAGTYSDLTSLQISAITPNEGVIINYKSLAFNTITFKTTNAQSGANQVAEVRYAITAFV